MSLKETARRVMETVLSPRGLTYAALTAGVALLGADAVTPTNAQRINPYSTNTAYAEVPEMKAYGVGLDGKENGNGNGNESRGDGSNKRKAVKREEAKREWEKKHGTATPTRTATSTPGPGFHDGRKDIPTPTATKEVHNNQAATSLRSGVALNARLISYLNNTAKIPERPRNIPSIRSTRTSYTEVGADPGIFTRGAKSAPLGAVGVDYVEGSGWPWIIGFQSERDYGGGCPRFDFRSSSSPINVGWSGRSDGGWSVNFGHDFVNKTHPCGDNMFNWQVFMDQSWMFPTADRTASRFKVNYSTNLPNGSFRLIAGIQYFINGGRAQEVELSLALRNWGDAFPNDPKVVAAINNSAIVYVHAYGRAWDLTASEGSDQETYIEWPRVISDLMNAGYLDRVSDWRNTATASLWIGMETNNRSATNSAAANLLIKDFRTYDLGAPLPTPTPTIVPTSTPTAAPDLDFTAESGCVVSGNRRVPFISFNITNRQGRKIVGYSSPNVWADFAARNPQLSNGQIPGIYTAPSRLDAGTHKIANGTTYDFFFQDPRTGERTPTRRVTTPNC